MKEDTCQTWRGWQEHKTKTKAAHPLDERFRIGNREKIIQNISRTPMAPVTVESTNASSRCPFGNRGATTEHNTTSQCRGATALVRRHGRPRLVDKDLGLPVVRGGGGAHTRCGRDRGVGAARVRHEGVAGAA